MHSNSDGSDWAARYQRGEDLTGFRVVAVHAHPDDEVLFSGGTLADLAARGAEVTVITITLGEEGEVIGHKYADLESSALLAGFRANELAQSLSYLGVRGEILGGWGKYRDSGMAGSPAHDHSDAQINRREEVVADLAAALQRLRPHEVITYGPDGGYGHPDHIAAHEATHAAVAQLRSQGEPYPHRIWWCIFERDAISAALARISPPPQWSLPDAAYTENFTNPGSDLRHWITPTALAQKLAAMRAHATQIWLADGTTTDVWDHPIQAQWQREAGDPLLSQPVTAETAEERSSVIAAVYALSNNLAFPVLNHEDYHLGWQAEDHTDEKARP